MANFHKFGQVKKLGQGAALIAAFGLQLPEVNAVEHTVETKILTSTPDTVTKDIVIKDGILRGQMLSTSGQGAKAVSIELRQSGKIISVTKTAEDGTFAFHGLSSGYYQVVSTRGSQFFRTWSAEQAPLNSQANLILTEGQIIRGQAGALSIANMAMLGGTIGAITAGTVKANDDVNKPASP